MEPLRFGEAGRVLAEVPAGNDGWKTKVNSIRTCLQQLEREVQRNNKQAVVQWGEMAYHFSAQAYFSQDPPLNAQQKALLAKVTLFFAVAIYLQAFWEMGSLLKGKEKQK